MTTVPAIAGIVPAICARLTPELVSPQREYIPFEVDGQVVGWIDDERAARLGGFPQILSARPERITFVDSLAEHDRRTEAMDQIARSLAQEGRLSAWRDERYAVAAHAGARVVFDIERAAARYFGFHTTAAHINGLVQRGDGDGNGDGGAMMWLARRSATKAIDPGMLDNLVGGGVAVGLSVQETAIKEAWEEAGIPQAIAAQAELLGTAQVCREQRHGLQRETVFIFDLWLAPDFVPVNQDGEASAHRLVTLLDAARLIAVDAGPDQVTADASLVILDCLLRRDVINLRTSDRFQLAVLSELQHPSLVPESRPVAR